MALTVGAISANDNVIQVDTNMGVARADMPYTGYRLKVGTEGMWCFESSADGKTLRVLRGIDGTTAAAQAAGSTITAYGTIVAAGTKAGIPADGDYPAGQLPPVGTIVYDTTNSKLSVRHGAGSWKQSAALA